MPPKSKTKRLACHPTLGNQPLLGVEIELEGIPFERESHNPMAALGLNEWSEWWRATYDGTLRNGGVEFVSRDIQSQKSLRTSLHRMMKEVYSLYDVQESLRTSSHIHVDIRNLSTIQLGIFLLNLVVREEELYVVGGEGRETSPFCVPCNNPIGIITLIDRAFLRRGISTPGQRSTIASMSLKYSGINPEPVSRMGSVELRYFNPIVKGAVFVRITNIILECYEKAASYNREDSYLSEVPPSLRRLITHSPLAVLLDSAYESQ